MAPRLHPGERLLYTGHPSWRSALPLYLKGLGLTGGAALAVAAIGGFRAEGPDPALVMAVALVGVTATLVGGLAKRMATRYAVTDRRLQIRHGVLSRTVHELPLQRVRNVTYRQTALQRLLQVGDVNFAAEPGAGAELVFSGVARPARVVADLDGADRLATPHRPRGAE